MSNKHLIDSALPSRNQHLLPYRFVWLIMMGIILVTSLACSVGALAVAQPTPTATPRKTPQPTFTFTPPATSTRTPTPTLTPSATPTETPVPTNTPIPEDAEGEGNAQAPPPPPPPPQPAEPAATPTPEEPTATPTPEFEFKVDYYIHDTGSPGQMRMTAWIRIDYKPGYFDTLSGFTMKAIAPDGNTYFSEVSGPGFGDSTVKGTGDNHNMNTKLEFVPYLAGTYKISLLEGDTQVSPEIEINLSADPYQYPHFDFYKQGPQD